MTVDEIIATGQYTDKRGRGWEKGWGTDCWAEVIAEVGDLAVVNDIIRESQMRLLIERDLHKCDALGLAGCHYHPVISVTRHLQTGRWLVFDERGIEHTGPTYREWEDAMNAARALAVGE